MLQNRTKLHAANRKHRTISPSVVLMNSDDDAETRNTGDYFQESDEKSTEKPVWGETPESLDQTLFDAQPKIMKRRDSIVY